MSATMTHPLDTFERRDRGEGRDYRGQPDRRMVTEWVIATGTDKDGEPAETVAQVTTGHDSGSKALVSRFSWVARHERATHPLDMEKGSPPRFRTEKWSSDNTVVRLASTPVARYSKKALEAAHAEAIETLLARYSGTNLERVTAEAAAYPFGEEW